jgi:predicted RNase H-like nuclease
VTRHLGIDLAWGPRARTGLAALDADGRLVASTSVRTDDEIATFVEEHGGSRGREDAVAAFDAPLVVPNATGMRPCEVLVSREFGRYDAGTYPANRSNPLFAPPRAETLARRFGWATDPAVLPGDGRSVAIEVYPHPAMVVLFDLGRVLPYKDRRGRDVESLRAAFGLLLGHLERVCGATLDLGRSERGAAIRDGVAGARRKSELRLLEDEVDAVLCAYLAWLWARRDPTMRVLGTARDGYVVVPGTPRVPPAPRVAPVPSGRVVRGSTPRSSRRPGAPDAPATASPVRDV